jgi:glutaminyl-peptide cyclotransferase
MENFSYKGEGWGLCFDGKYFFMSDGSNSIFKRDPKTFAVVSSVQVLQDGKPINNLNELECVGNSVYANVWMTNTILRIQKATGKITAVIDASGLLTPEESKVHTENQRLIYPLINMTHERITIYAECESVQNYAKTIC